MKRWIYLLLGMIANIAQGVAYASSVLAKPLMEMVGVTDPAQVKLHFALIFTLSCCFLPVGMIFGGKLATVSPRIPIALGAVIYGAGLFMSGFVRDYYTLCVTFGLMLSVGSGLAYGPIVASAVRWFPDRKGFASGLVVSALGFGPAVIAPICSWLLKDYSFSIYAVLQILGVSTFIAIGLASFITSPQEQTAAESGTHREVKRPEQFTCLQMLCTCRFYFLALLLFLALVPGLMVISGADGIFQTFGGFTVRRAAVMVGALAIANALGRFLWGWISDNIGRINAMSVMFGISTLSMLMLPQCGGKAVLLLVVILVIGSTYGGYLGLFPSFCADAFGSKNVAINYAVLFIAFSAAALAGPSIYGVLEPAVAFYIAAGLSLAGLAVTYLYKRIP